MHDWNITDRRGAKLLHYYSRISNGDCWLLLEFEKEPEMLPYGRYGSINVR